MIRAIKELTRDQAWIIIENVMENVFALEETNPKDADAKRCREVLDILSPNWETADCIDVKNNKIAVEIIEQSTTLHQKQRRSKGATDVK